MKHKTTFLLGTSFLLSTMIILVYLVNYQYFCEQVLYLFFKTKPKLIIFYTNV